MIPKFSYLLFFILAPLHFLGQIKIENYSLQKPDSNVLYIGVANKIHISGLKNVSKAKVLLNGRYYTIEKNGLFYIYTSNVSSGSLQVVLNSKVIASKIFHSARITEPMVLLGNFRDTSLSKSVILNYEMLRVIMPNCILAHNLSVISYQITFTSKNKLLNLTDKIIGAQIPVSLIAIVKQLESGDKIQFDDIRIAGPDDSPMDSFFITVK